MTRAGRLLAGIVLIGALVACASDGVRTSTSVSYGVGYGRYYGASPWGYYPGYPVYVGGAPDLPSGPVATPLPDFGMPDMPDAGFADFPDF
jgi:hypothetical protein